MKIAKTLGGRTVDELAETISCTEFREWQEYFMIEKEQMEKKQKEAKSKAKGKI